MKSPLEYVCDIDADVYEATGRHLRLDAREVIEDHLRKIISEARKASSGYESPPPIQKQEALRI